MLDAILKQLSSFKGWFAFLEATGVNINWHDQAERKVLIPESKRVDIMAEFGVKADKLETGHKLFKALADAVSDLLLFLVSRGEIGPD